MKTTLLVIAAGLMLVGTGCATTTTKPTNDGDLIITTTDDAEVKVAERFKLSGLSFALPWNWEIVSIEDGTARLHVPDSRYTVVIPFQVTKRPDGFHVITEDDEMFLADAGSGAKIYHDVCAPALACYTVVYGEDRYSVAFGEPDESDEPVPENLDGVWFHSTEITKEEMETMVLSVTR